MRSESQSEGREETLLIIIDAAATLRVPLTCEKSIRLY